MTGLAAAHVGDLDLHQVEAHHVGVEAMGGLRSLTASAMWLMPMASTVVGAANVRRMFTAWGDHARRLTEHVTVLSTLTTVPTRRAIRC